MARRIGRRHNNGPSLDDYRGPPWGKGDACVFLSWKKAHRAAWRAPSRDVMLMRLERAERIGLTYEDYSLEILERGRYLQAEDIDRIAEIKAKRKRRPTRHFAP
jgi:hypothetical protein